MDKTQQPGIAPGHAVIIQPELAQSAQLEVFDHHIGRVDQRLQPLKIGGVVEIADNRALAAIGGVEIGGDGFGRAIRTRPLDKGRAPAAGVVAFRGLDLDHLGAQIGQRLTDPGTGQNPGQLDDLQPLQRRLAHQ